MHLLTLPDFLIEDYYDDQMDVRINSPKWWWCMLNKRVLIMIYQSKYGTQVDLLQDWPEVNDGWDDGDDYCCYTRNNCCCCWLSSKRRGGSVSDNNCLLNISRININYYLNHELLIKRLNEVIIDRNVVWDGDYDMMMRNMMIMMVSLFMGSLIHIHGFPLYPSTSLYIM